MDYPTLINSVLKIFFKRILFVGSELLDFLCDTYLRGQTLHYSPDAPCFRVGANSKNGANDSRQNSWHTMEVVYPARVVDFQTIGQERL